MRVPWTVLATLVTVIAGLATIVAVALQLSDRSQQRSALTPTTEIVEAEPPLEEDGEKGGALPSLPRRPTGVPAEPAPKAPPAAGPDLKSLINRTLVPATSTPLLALALDGNPTDVERLEAALARELSSASVRLVPGLFKPGFRTSGFLQSSYEGDTEILARSGALALVDRILLGRLERACEKTNELDANLVTCTLHLHYKTVDNTGTISSAGSVSVIGPGFSEDAARDRALEMLVEQHGERLVASERY